MTAPQSAIIDIPHSGSWARFRLLRVLIVVAMVSAAFFVGVVGILFLRANPVAPMWVVPAGLWLACVSTAISLALLARRRTGRRVAAIVAQHRSDPRTAMEQLIPKLVLRYVQVGMSEAAKALRAAGHTGIVLRIGPPPTLTPVDPLTVEFEPLPLNEADAAFVALRDGEPASPERSAAPARPGAGGDANGEESSLLRNLRRAARLGRVRMWVIFGVMCLMAAIDAFERRQITGRLILWSLLLGFSVIGPLVLAAERGMRFLLLPSSLLWRRSRFRMSAYELHQFERERSVLCVCLLRKQSWIWAVADDSKSIGAFATSDEITMLLRGWLSPLPPPPLSRLSEFAGA